MKIISIIGGVLLVPTLLGFAWLGTLAIRDIVFQHDIKWEQIRPAGGLFLISGLLLVALAFIAGIVSAFGG